LTLLKPLINFYNCISYSINYKRHNCSLQRRKRKWSVFVRLGDGWQVEKRMTPVLRSS